jgi:hypothetical protein
VNTNNSKSGAVGTKIAYSTLVAMLSGTNGAIPVGIVATTDAKARKTGNPHGLITKTVRAVGFVGADYEKSVQTQTLRAGVNNPDFVADKLPWGEWVVDKKVIAHKGKFYLRTQTTSGMRRKQAARVVCYRNEAGQFIGHDEAKKFIPEVKESAKQADAGLEGVRNQVWVRTYAFDSLDRVRIAGRTYVPVANE